MSGRKVFTAGEVLQAADVNDYLMDQSVMVFAGTAARGSAIPSPSEGMVTYRSDDDVVEVYNGASFVPVGPGQILQVVSTTKTDTFSTTSNSPVAITGATVTITPTSASSKVFVTFTSSVDSSTSDVKAFQLLRDSTVVGGGTPAGSRLSAITAQHHSGATTRQNISASFLDSPATTSAITYSVTTWADVSGRVTYIGRSHADGDTSQPANARTSFTITAMEVAG